VPVLLITDLTAEQKRAYTITDNRLAELAGWDQDLLTEGLGELTDLGFDVTLTGFDGPDLDGLMEDHHEAPEPDDVLPDLTGQVPVTKPSDLWSLGAHKLLCGDATDSAAFAQLMGDQRAHLVITDPPYNVRVADVARVKRRQHKEFAMASGEMSGLEFETFLKTVMTELVAWSVPGSLHYIFMDWRHLQSLLVAAGPLYRAYENLCVWAKTNFGMGGLYRSQHELVAVFRNGGGRQSADASKRGRNRSNVWRYAGVNVFRDGRDEDLADHPTVKPVAMIIDAIKDGSQRGNIVLDPFSGSGTTILAAERVGRRAFSMEIAPIYVDTAIERWQKATKKDALLVAKPTTCSKRASPLSLPQAPRPPKRPKPRCRSRRRRGLKIKRSPASRAALNPSKTSQMSNLLARKAT
jgi:DNA modification methylase